MFENLSWYRIQATFKIVSLRNGTLIRPVTIMESVIKEIQSLNTDTSAVNIIFHIDKTDFMRQYEIDTLFSVTFLLFYRKKEAVFRWYENFLVYFNDYPVNSSQKYHHEDLKLIESLEPDLRTISDLYEETSLDVSLTEIRLHFYSPFPLTAKAKAQKSPGAVRVKDFISACKKRIEKLFSLSIDTGKIDTEKLTFLPWYWRYKSFERESHSNRNSYSIRGYSGDCWLKGDIASVFPLILLCSELHSGEKLSFGQGYFTLHNADSSPQFLGDLYNTKMYTSVLHAMLTDSDRAAEEFELLPKEKQNVTLFCRELCDEIRPGIYEPEPSNTIFINKSSGGKREIELYSLREMVVHKVLHKILNRIFDTMFSPCSIGFRKGKSPKEVKTVVNNAWKKGYRYVVESDLENFFPSIDHTILFEELSLRIPEADRKFFNLIKKCITAPGIVDGETVPRRKGLAQGSPLSPVLTNLYLDIFDKKMIESGRKIIRFCDDFIILTKTHDDAVRALNATRKIISDISLSLNEEKTSIKRISDGFEFLGMQFGTGKMDIPFTGKIFRKSLYICDVGVFAGINGDAVELRKYSKVFEIIPLRRISEIIILNQSSISAACICKCRDMHIPITILKPTGHFVTTFSSDNGRHYELIAKHTTKTAALTQGALLAISMRIAESKLKNYITLFRKKCRKKHSVIDELEKLCDSLNRADSIEAVRGYEGAAARKVFSAMGILINDSSFKSNKRERKKPDRLNSMMNFTYHLTASRINALLRAKGLNPYCAFLHGNSGGYETLAWDLIEPFRAILDSFIIRMINIGIVQAESFTKTQSGYYLHGKEKKKFLMHYEREFERIFSKNRLSLKKLLSCQVMVVKKWVTDDQTLSFYLWERG